MAARCPNCGNLNSEGSKFCSSCGHGLGLPTKGQCPECGTLNSPSNIFCDKCGARLFPARSEMDAKGDESPVRGLSLPSKEPSEDDVPDWLDQLRSSFGEPEGEGVSPDEPGPAPSGDEMPDWLRAAGLSGGSGAASSGSDLDDLPDWLPDEATDADAPTLVPSGDDIEPGELPDWLQQLRPREAARDEGAPGPTPSPVSSDEAEPADLPDWLQRMRPQDESVPEEVEPVVSPPREVDALDSTDLPDWLRSIQPEEEARVEGPPVPVPPPREVGALDSADLPAWLRSIEPEEEAPDQEAAELTPAPAGEAAGPSDLPDWLRNMGPEEEAPDQEAAEPTPVPAGGAAGPSDLPDWLREIQAPEEAPDEEAAEPTPVPAGEAAGPSDLPDWLRAIQSKEEALEAELAEGAPGVLPKEPEPSVPTLASDELEDWLEGMQDQERAAPDLEAPADEEMAEMGELPAWLQEFALVGDESDMPGLAPAAPLILDGEGPEAEPTPEQRPAKAPRLPSPAEVSALEDWLGETAQPVEEKAAPTKALGGTGPLVPPELPEWLAAVSESAEDELPGWLAQEEETDTLLKPDTGELKPPPVAPLPSWLTDEDAGVPVTREEIAELPTQPEAGLAPAELPDWLRMPPAAGRPGTGELAGRAAFLADLDAIDMAAAPAAGVDIEAAEIERLGLVQAEIPDWLQALRPQEVRERPPPVEEVEELEPVEMGGFLDGVRGALKARSEVSIIPTRQVLLKFAPTEQQRAHAQVLEQIVHAGPSPVPDVAQIRRPKAWLERLVIPILLLAAILLPAWMGNPLQGFVGEEVGSQQVIDTYNLLELELSSDSVVAVVAFDYTPAEAAELNPVSAVFMRHMMDRGAKILAVSTAPTGPELAQGVLEESAGDRVYGDDYLNLGYIPGGAAGLQAFANNPWSLFSGTDYPGRFETGRTAPAAAGLGDSLADVDILLILTADRDDLIGWVEQVGRLEEMQKVEIVAGTSASLEPWAQPYFLSRIDGVVSGIPGAAQYEQRLDPHESAQLTDSALYLRDSQLLGLGVSVILITVGLLWGIGYGLVSRRRRDG
jgi:hypothetical protein